MRVSLVGADCEENLGLGMIAGSLIRAGHQVRVIPYDAWDEIDAVVERVLASRPEVIGLAIQFQHGAPGFLGLAERLRRARYRGHITCGGQYPTMSWSDVLAHEPSIDSVVLHEGELTMVELVAALRRGHALSSVAGLAVRGPSGVPERTAPRPLCADLDQLPFTHRYRPATRHLGIPFLPISGSRGCWGACSFCAIATYYRDAHEHGVAGRKLRLRSPSNIADEMARLWHREQGPCLFCFHDDTMLLPRPADSLERLSAIRRELDQRGVGTIGLVGKCRPDCVTEALAKKLYDLGVVRMFVGIENGSQRGLDHLQRRTEIADLEAALGAMRTADIFVCYNLLLFEPECVLADLRDNVAFMRRHAGIPVNFCRAEPYTGTPLHRQIRDRGALIGNYLGWDYRITDDRAELAFRIAAAAFRERNYGIAGVANRAMGFGYMTQILKRFYDVSSSRAHGLLKRADDLLCAVTLDTADLLEQAIDIAERADLSDHDRITRQAVVLGMRVAAQDRIWHNRIDELTEELHAHAANHPRTPVGIGLQDKARAALGRLAFATCVVASTQACGGSADSDSEQSSGGQSGTSAPTRGGTQSLGGSATTASGGRSNIIQGDGGAPPRGGSGAMGGVLVTDPGPLPLIGGSSSIAPGGGRGGMIAYDGGAPPTGGRSATGGYTVADMGGMPVIGGRSGGGSSGKGGVATGGVATGAAAGAAGRGRGGLSGDGGATPFAGRASVAGSPTAGNAGVRVNQAGSPGGSLVNLDFSIRSGSPRDEINPVDPPPTPIQATDLDRSRNGVADYWHDPAPQRLTRSEDLPLSDPPAISLETRRSGDQVAVTLRGGGKRLSLRWQAEGKVVGKGRVVTWYPASPDDALRVAVRGTHGVVFTLLRARDVGV